MRTRLALFMAGAVLTALACGPAAQPGPAQTGDTGQPKAGGTLSVRVVTDPWDWDISTSKSNPNDDGVALAYDALLTFKTGADLQFNEMIVQPELAERWEVSTDAKVYTFHLRKGVKFHDLPPVNGRELTSADVKWTFEYRTRSAEFADKKLPPGEVSYIFEGMERIETPDPYTVRVHFKDPFVPFVHYAASDWNPILPKEIYEKDGHFKETVVGTGPFILDVAGSQKGSRWAFNKNPNYWDTGKPYVDQVRWLVLPNETTAYAGFQTKQLDLLETVPYNDAQEVIKTNPNVGQDRYLLPVAGLMYFSMSPARNGPLQDVRLRRAIALATDRDEINKVAFGGTASWGVSGAFDGLFTEAEARDLQKFDPDQARRLVTEAGYANGVTVEWPVPSDEDKADISMMELIQSQVKKVGINIELKFLERAAQRGKRRSGDFDIDAQMIPSLGLMHDDPDSVVFGRLYSKSAQNYNKINDPELDKMVLATRAETNPEKRRELMRNVSRRVVENAYTVQLLHPVLFGFWQPHLKDYRPNFGSQSAYKFAWVDK